MPGNSPDDWQIASSGDPSIQGFATDISVNVGQTVSFKISTPSTAYHIDIYRFGYYGGSGARKVATVTPSVSLPQTQPPCLSDETTNLLDCGSWAVSASWAVPSTAVSGVYFANLIRTDAGGSSQIYFIVRNDASHSDLLFQTSDETWQAYNDYGGHSLYGGAGEFNLPGRGMKVSYNRPLNTRKFQPPTFFYSGEYPMVRWLEANGYDVTYFTGVDAARFGSLIRNHKVFLSVGHDEYWSGPQRTNVEAARDAGVHLAFFSGNEVFWKVRWENSIDSSHSPYRTMVCYKETLAGTVSDPSDPPVWTGTWRDPRFSPPGDGGRPENALTGTIFTVNGPGPDNLNLSIQVPAEDGKMRFWRNTSIATQNPGEVAILPPGTLGYEWDEDLDNGARPVGLIRMSTATYDMTIDRLLDYGGIYGAGPATHHLTLYRAPSGALVFGAGTVQWAWGLDDFHDGDITPTDVRMQQATVNLFADMGVQPGSIQEGLAPATKSTDATPPASTILSPASGATVTAGTTVTISGTATDSGGGVVGGVEVSVDGGQTWHPATGRGTWTYSWNPAMLGSAVLISRAVDDSGNIESLSSGTPVSVAAQDCPCQGWNTTAVPSQTDSGDPSPVEIGVKFHSDYDGYITGIRFFKGSANTGTHTGNLWSSSGTLLASATFINETASGWQQVDFSSPVHITANTIYVASYFAPQGHYSASPGFFTYNSIDTPPLHFPGIGNGVYIYSPTPAFPTDSYAGTNYWIDVIYRPDGSLPGAPASLSVLPSSLNFAAYQGLSNPPAQIVEISNEGTGSLSWTATSSAPWLLVSPASGNVPSSLSISVNTSGLASGTYTGTVTINAPGAANTPQTVPVSLVVTSLLLSSNFDDGTTEGWLSSPLGLASGWSAASQFLQYNGGGHTQLYTGNSAWADYTFQTDFKLSSLTNYPGGIRGRINPTTGASYTVWLYPADGLIKLYRTVAWNIDSGFTLLGSASVTFDAQNFHKIALSFQGSQIQVLYDGASVLTVADSTNTSGLVAFDVSNQPITFDNAVVTAPSMTSAALAPSPASLSFSAFLGTNPNDQTVQFTPSGTGSLAWTAVATVPWVSVSPASGLGASSLQVSAASASLAAGTYTGAIRITTLGGTPSSQLVNVTLNVVAVPPSIVVAPTTLTFESTAGQSSPANQSLAISNGGSGTFSWTAATDAPWLSVSLASGSAPAATNVSINTAGLTPGTYTGHVTISAAGVPNSPQSIPVTLTLLAANLNETFSSSAAGWIISPMGLGNGWSVAGGTYSFSGIGLSQSCAGNAGWADYLFDTNIKLSNLSNWPGGVRGRVNPATGAGYAVWLYPASNLAILYRVGQWNINAGLATLAQAPLTFDTNAHTLRMSFQGSQISVYWDGTLLMTATDTNYTSGYVCLDADSQPISYSNVRVGAVQNPASLTAAPTSVSFAAAPGSNPAPQTVNISAAGAATTWAVTVSPGASWLTATASTSLTPGAITLAVNATGLSQGSYSGSVTVTAPGAANSPLVIPVTLGVKTAVLSVNPVSLSFLGASNANPATQTLSVANSGTGSLSWTASADAAWISLSPASGTAPGSIVVTANTVGMAVGDYTGNITILSNDAPTPVTVAVALRVVSSLLFTDNFSTGAGNWTISPLGNAAGWSVANNAYSYNGQGATVSWAGSSTWTNYSVAADFRLSSMNNYPGGIRGRINPSTGSGYAAWIYPAERVIKLFRVNQWFIDDGFTLLAQSGQVGIDAANPHNLRLAFQGNQIQVYLDDNLVTQATDSTFTQGAIGFDVSNQPISFSNVLVLGL
ncbi:MAG TPA: N,N-dimethylformamidase beta subunit family domain-containing protein [Bryobacteraceae bacterium]|nr:N,N-dimethylformamidase beta subunit family domain-containing protein [Bryobacteraceae bacterium]